MTLPDAINATFEVCGCVAMSYNVAGLLKDKQVKGFRLAPMIFFTSWGFWNLYFYSHLSQLLSFVGSAAMTAVNFLYVCLVIYYNRRNRRADEKFLASLLVRPTPARIIWLNECAAQSKAAEQRGKDREKQGS